MRPGAAGAAATAIVVPATGDLFGFPFEIAPMVMAVTACLIVRIYKGAKAKSHEGWIVDLSITLLTMLFTVAFVIGLRPNPILAASLGTGMGAIGAGLIRIAEKKTGKFFDDAPDDEQDGEEAMRRAMERVKGLP
jgi:hypothetical protein